MHQYSREENKKRKRQRERQKIERGRQREREREDAHERCLCWHNSSFTKAKSGLFLTFAIKSIVVKYVVIVAIELRIMFLVVRGWPMHHGNTLRSRRLCTLVGSHPVLLFYQRDRGKQIYLQLLTHNKKGEAEGDHKAYITKPSEGYSYKTNY